jgi:hypothetical protein
MIFFSNIFCLNLWKLFRVIFTNLGHFPKFEKWYPHPFSKRRNKKKKRKEFKAYMMTRAENLDLISIRRLPMTISHHQTDVARFRLLHLSLGQSSLIGYFSH